MHARDQRGGRRERGGHEAAHSARGGRRPCGTRGRRHGSRDRIAASARSRRLRREESRVRAARARARRWGHCGPGPVHTPGRRRRGSDGREDRVRGGTHRTGGRRALRCPLAAH